MNVAQDTAIVPMSTIPPAYRYTTDCALCA